MLHVFSLGVIPELERAAKAPVSMHNFPMLRTTFWTFVALVLLLTLHQRYSAQSQSSVEGVVLEAATGKPLERVRVTLQGPAPEFVFGSPPTFGEGITDSQGRFGIQAVKPGRYRVVPELEGFVYSRPARFQAPREPGIWIQVAAGQQVQNLELRMVREAVITGRAFDAPGQPLVNPAIAALQRYKYDDYGNRQLGGIRGIFYPGAAWSFVRMDDRGEFRFYGLQRGDYYLYISGGGAVGAPSVTYYPGTLDQTKAVPIHLEGGEELRLGSINQQPAPAKGVQVRFHFADDGSVPQIREVYFRQGAFLPVSRGERGRITIEAVAPGRYDVQLTAGMLAGAAVIGEPLYSQFSLDVGESDVDRDIVWSRAFRPKASFMIEDASGRRSASGINCRLRSDFGLAGCTTAMAPGFCKLELQGVPPDAYIASAKVSGRDILPDGVQIDSEPQIEILFATPGGIVEGTVTDSKDQKIADAVVVLVPDGPMRSAGPMYRSIVSDNKGHFELRGIAPGAYRLFSWSELEGAAYRNAEFMKKFEERGKPVRMEKGGKVFLDVKILDEPESGQK